MSIKVPYTEEPIVSCPHCGNTTPFAVVADPAPKTAPRLWSNRKQKVATVHVLTCRVCEGLVIDIEWTHRELPSHGGFPPKEEETGTERVYPLAPRPPPLGTDVPQDIADAFREAWSLRGVNERAAAVMARRCLQLALRRAGYGPKRNLDQEIIEAEGAVSPGLATQLHVVRTVGNVGAHPEDADGGLSFERLLSVEPTEVDALFSALREFFDEIFVRPKRQERELEALNKKLEAAGKKPIGPKKP